MKYKEFRVKLEEFEQSLIQQYTDEIKDTEITFDNMGEYTLYTKDNIIRDIIISKLTSWKVGDVFEITQTAKSVPNIPTIAESFVLIAFQSSGK